jgi:hypothetical protein
MKRVQSVALQPGSRVFLADEDGIELTLLAPGAFDLGRGEFIACDEHGRAIRGEPAALTRSASEEKGASARVNVVRAAVVFGITLVAALVVGLLLNQLLGGPRP